MQKISSRQFWKGASLLLGLFLLLAVAFNISGIYQVPKRFTLLATGILIAIGVGYFILEPRSSLHRLNQRDEHIFRSRQVIVSVVFSILLSLSLLNVTLRQSLLIYLFAPIILLPLYLMIALRKK